MVQMHCIDMNAWYSRVDKPERPDYVLFDLDPPDGGFAQRVRVAHLVRDLSSSELGLGRYVKTSGADGMHVFVPIDRATPSRRPTRSPSPSRAALETRHPGSSRPSG